ncbi:Sucrose transporter and related proteins [Phaffia rhodozyma]|uniref:Sucrose transporter and related proteins n=1 Tax=Phaffia rhodozyma TaxID=264483 RepID=A0A0F7SIP9_PHARH|nr:Sucrose transporter and related proteins [Phaffia rhodozyma]
MTAGGGLLIPNSEEDDPQLRWVGKPSIIGPSWMKYPLLTLGMLGVQSVWTIEMSQASPFLIELGLSKSLMSLVFVAGPLSGLIMQPLIGSLADRSKARLGRRRPFIIVGCCLTIIAMYLLSWAKDLGSILSFGSATQMKVISIGLAILAVFLVDFSVNAIMAADRALLVDTLPPSQQEAGNAWAGRLSGFGSVAGFWIGNVDLLKIFPFLASTQLKALTVITVLSLVGTHGLMVWGVKERVLIEDSRPKSTLGGTLKSIWVNALTLPKDIRNICIVQFFAWIGWFPILFFTSVWVSDLYIHQELLQHPNLSHTDPTLLASATRAGSKALFYNALVSFATAVFIPFLVAPSTLSSPSYSLDQQTESGDIRRGEWSEGKEGWSVKSLQIKWLTLGRVWLFSHGVFALTMFATWFADSVTGANMIIGLTGFCWAIAGWAPFSILGELILSCDAPPPSIPLRSRSTLTVNHDHSHSTDSLSLSPSSPTNEQVEREGLMGKTSFESNERVPDGIDGEDNMEVNVEVDGDTEEGQENRRPQGGSTAEKAGVILGIHNVAIVIPQFIITFLSSIIFYLLDPDRQVVHLPVPPAISKNSTIPAGNFTNLFPDVKLNSTVTDLRSLNGEIDWLARQDLPNPSSPPDAVGFIFRFGGASACIAFYLCWRMLRGLQRQGRLM